MIVSYIYWEIRCHGCKAPYDYCYLGVLGSVNPMGMPIQHPFRFRCLSCDKSDIYNHFDLHIRTKDHPPRPDDVFLGELAE
jgi:hypothetical protein